MDYETARRKVYDICHRYGWQQIKDANKEMKSAFGNALSQIRGGQDIVKYSIVIEEDGELEFHTFAWDFFYREFAD